jgi:hypothetical protein
MKYVFVLLLSILVNSTFGQRPKKVIKKLGADPVFFIDSINVDKAELNNYQPTEIAAVSVYKDSNAINLVGPDGKDGAVYLITKKFAKNKYWQFFKSKSSDYEKIALTVESDSSFQYVLNKRLLKINFEGDLYLIDDDIFKNIKIIDKATLQKEFGVTDKEYGVLIESDKPADLYRAKKKF